MCVLRELEGGVDRAGFLPWPGSKAWVVPFWTIRRVTDKKLSNCTLAEIEVDVIHTGGIGGERIKVDCADGDARIVFGSSLKVPVITNLEPLAKDCELVLYMEPVVVKKKAKAKPVPPRKRAKMGTALAVTKAEESAPNSDTE